MLQSRVTEVLGVEVPIVLAPVVPMADAGLAAAVSNAGGLGTFGAWSAMGIDERSVRRQITKIRELTDRPFGAGFATHHIPVCRSHLDAVLEECVPVVLLSFADPSPWVGQIHEAGSKVICQVQTFDGAREAVAAGVDVLCVQGNEAGGHTGPQNLLPFLVQVLDAFPDTPTIAAGGISSGRSLAAVLAAGAEGAWLGTALLAATEAVSLAQLAQAIVESDGRDTIYSGVVNVLLNSWGPARPLWPASIAVRTRRSALTDRWHGREAELAADESAVRDYLERLAKMDPEVFPMLYGEGAGTVTRVAPAREIIETMLADARQRLGNANSMMRSDV